MNNGNNLATRSKSLRGSKAPRILMNTFRGPTDRLVLHTTMRYWGLPGLTLSFDDAKGDSIEENDRNGNDKAFQFAGSEKDGEPGRDESYFELKRKMQRKTKPKMKLPRGNEAMVFALRIPGQTVANPDKTQRDLAEGEIVQNNGRKRGGNSGHEQYTGVIQADDGTKYNVYLRHMNKEQAVSRPRKELAAYKLNSMLEFDNGFPGTSIRRFDIDGKEKYGAVQVDLEIRSSWRLIFWRRRGTGLTRLPISFGSWTKI